jgi:hypothetical protein
VQKNFVRGEEDTPKSHRVRSVPLSDQAFVALDALSRRQHFTGPDDLVFGSDVGRHVLDDDVRAAFYDALEDAELGHLREKDDPIVFHDLRHTFGTLAIRRAPVTDVQYWMGHADIQTTMRYVHYVPSTTTRRSSPRRSPSTAKPCTRTCTEPPTCRCTERHRERRTWLAIAKRVGSACSLNPKVPGSIPGGGIRKPPMNTAV